MSPYKLAIPTPRVLITIFLYLLLYGYMTIKILSVGTKPSREISSIIADYSKRLPSNISIDWQYLKHSNTGDVNTSKQQESESILRAIKDKDVVFLLDERGQLYSSPEVSRLMFDKAQNIVVIIGGAHGVSENIFKRADYVWSLSKLVFPHQLVRLILSEQLYRAYTISINHPYHHE
jgi:23S rRNA (pseudouridine1915-N3)-methyltransferase